MILQEGDFELRDFLAVYSSGGGRARKNPLRLATVRSGSFVDHLVMKSVPRNLFSVE